MQNKENEWKFKRNIQYKRYTTILILFDTLYTHTYTYTINNIFILHIKVVNSTGIASVFQLNCSQISQRNKNNNAQMNKQEVYSTTAI